MKKIFCKHNTATRLMALWLAFIMMAVPLFTDSGLLSYPKAETQTVSQPEVNLNLSIEDSMISWNSATPNNISMNYNSSITNTFHFYGVDSISGSSITATPPTCTELTVGMDTLDFSTASVSVMYKVNNSESIINVSVTETSDLKELDDITITDGDYLAVYMKIENVLYNSNSISTGEYCLQNIYKFEKTDPFDNSFTAQWKDETDCDISENNWYKTGKISIPAKTSAADYMDSTKTNYLGVIKYGYKLPGSNDITWQTDQIVNFSDNIQGQVDGYVGYFTKATDNIPAKQYEIPTNIKIDTKAPMIDNNKSGLYYKADGWTNNTRYNSEGVVKVTATNEVRESSKYRYFVVAEDAGSGFDASGIKVLKNGTDEVTTVTFLKGTDCFYADAFFADNSSTDTYSINVTDKQGNKASIPSVPYVKNVDQSKRDITIKWGPDDTSLGPLPGGSEEVIIDRIYKIKCEITSYNPLQRISVTDKNDANIYSWGFEDEQPTPNPYYKYEETFSVPGVQTNAKYEDVVVNLIFDVNASTETVTENLASSLIYDTSKPVFYNSGTTTEYDISDEWNPDSDSIKIDIKSGIYDAESALKEAKYTVNGSTHDFTIIDGKVTGGAIDGDYVIESTDQIGTPITIYAKDEAGNETTKTVYYKKDITDPTFHFTTPLYFSKDSGTNKLTTGCVINKGYTLYANVSDNIGIKSITYKLQPAGGTPEDIYTNSDISGLKESIYLSDYMQDKTDGEYTIEVEAEDFAGNKTFETIAFTLDTVKPTCNNTVLQVSDDSIAWTDVSTGFYMEGEAGTSRKVYCIDDTKQYRYKVVVKDNKSLKNDAVKVKTGTPGTVSESTDTTIEKTFYISINNGQLVSSSYKDIEFDVTDTAGNTESFRTDWSLKTINKELLLSAKLFKSDGTEVELTDAVKDKLKNGSNQSYYIVLEASSAYKIDSDTVKLMYNTTVDVSGVDYNPVMQNNPEEKDNQGRYHYYKKYDISSGTNTLFTDFTVEAKDTSTPTPAYKKETLLSLLFDKTVPVLYKPGTTTEFTLPTEWRQSVSESIYVISGNDSVESKLSKVVYSVAGDTTEYPVQISADEVSASGIIQSSSGFSSATAAGTVITVYATDKAGNITTKYYTVKVDAEKPVINSVSVNGNAGILVSDSPLNVAPLIETKVTDNLTIDYIKYYITYPDGTVKEALFDYNEGVDAEVNGGTKTVSYTVPKLSEADANIPDGIYSVEVKAFDLAGNEATSVVKSFKVDATKPIVSATIGSGTVSNKSAYYYSSDVTVNLTYKDVNADMASVKVTDNGEPVSVNWSGVPDANGNYTASYKIASEGAHTIKITGKDRALNESAPSQVVFKLDKTNPSISTILNGGIAYTDNTGMLYLTNNVTLSVGVNDVNEDKEDLNYQLIVTKPDRATESNLYTKTTDRRFNYTEEGEYTINLFAADMANNLSPTRSVKFRIDKAAPSLSINGVGTGTSSDVVNVSCVMQESFWKDAKGTITIYRKAGDGATETLFDTIDVTPTSASTVISKSFSETGVYRIEFTASDRAGHTSETSATFTVDREAPVVTLDGPDNYAKTTEAVSVAITISDEFYIQKKVTLTGTRTDEEGKVHELDFGSWNAAANPTDISGEFEEDGIYDISVTATDVAGNSTSKSVHFTIDKTAPVIGDLSYLEDKIITSFSWDEDLDELVSDLTVCDIRMYLNGSEYDGTSDIEDGAYTLLITAKDELGNESEKEVKFVLDTKAPVFIVTGVEDNEVKNEDYTISVSLQLEEDTLTKVTLNGKEMSITNNTCTFTVTEKGNYTLVMTASDEAGNTAVYELGFKYGEESKIWIIITATAGTIFASGAGILIFRKKKIK